MIGNIISSRIGVSLIYSSSLSFSPSLSAEVHFRDGEKKRETPAPLYNEKSLLTRDTSSRAYATSRGIQVDR